MAAFRLSCSTLSASVAHLPERLSPTYRNRVHNLSPRNRNESVKHEPEKHTLTNQPTPYWHAYWHETGLILHQTDSDLRKHWVGVRGFEPRTSAV